MKKVTVAQVNERAEYFCDKHPDRPAYSFLKWDFGYGSPHDMDHIDLELCNECSEELIQHLKNYGSKLTEYY